MEGTRLRESALPDPGLTSSHPWLPWRLSRAVRWGGKEARKEEGGSEAAAKGRKEASKAGWETEQDQEAEEGKKDNRQGRRPVRGRREVRKQAKEKKKS